MANIEDELNGITVSSIVYDKFHEIILHNTMHFNHILLHYGVTNVRQSPPSICSYSNTPTSFFHRVRILKLPFSSKITLVFKIIMGTSLACTLYNQIEHSFIILFNVA